MSAAQAGAVETELGVGFDEAKESLCRLPEGMDAGHRRDRVALAAKAFGNTPLCAEALIRRQRCATTVTAMHPAAEDEYALRRERGDHAGAVARLGMHAGRRAEDCPSSPPAFLSCMGASKLPRT